MLERVSGFTLLPLVVFVVLVGIPLATSRTFERCKLISSFQSRRRFPFASLALTFFSRSFCIEIELSTKNPSFHVTGFSRDGALSEIRCPTLIFS